MVYDDLKKAMQELYALTDLPEDMNKLSEAEARRALNQVRMLMQSYKERYSTEHILKLYLSGRTESVEFLEQIQKLRIHRFKERRLFLIHCKQESKELIPEVLQGMFPSKNRDFLLHIDEDVYALIYEIKENEAALDPASFARSISDSLAMEAMVSVHIAYSRNFSDLQSLTAVYNSCRLNLNIGMIFYADRPIIPYNRLGIGGLIYRLPIQICENFLEELFGDNAALLADPETQHTINTFLEHNLNIAETSRKLHMHRNTLVYRIEQLEKSLGLEIKTIDGAMTFRIATMVVNYLNFIKGDSFHE